MEHSVSPPAPRPAFSGPVKGGSETILAIEDDVATRGGVVAVLQTLGYRILRAGDAASALDILQSGVPVDLLLARLAVPGAVRGPELAARARQLMPGIAVLFTSGSGQEAAGDDSGFDPGVELLSEPYGPDDLAHAIRHVLGNQQQVNALAKALRESQRRRETRRNPSRPLVVLLVEDQADVRDTSRQMLELFDCHVEAAATAEAAEAALRRAPFDVLLTDISLPGRSGIDLARRAAELQPAIEVVLSSGYSSVGVDTEGLAGVSVRHLPKPYGAPEIEALLGELRRA